MRRLLRNASLALVISVTSYWLFSSFVASTDTTVTDSQCADIDWYNAPVGFGQREWVPTYHGGEGPAKEQWQMMTDTDRAVALVKCGKERGE